VSFLFLFIPLMKNAETCFHLWSSPNIILFKIKRVTHDLITKSIALPQYKEPLPGFKLTER
jgi:hypothetical protein